MTGHWQKYFKLRKTTYCLTIHGLPLWMVLKLDDCIASNDLFDSAQAAAKWAKKEARKLDRDFERIVLE